MKNTQRYYLLGAVIVLSSLILCGLSFGRIPTFWLGTLWFCFIAVTELISFDYLKKQLPCKILEGNDSWGINQKLNKLCKSLRLKPPKIYTLQQKNPTLSTLAKNKSRSAIVISTGLLEKLTLDEIEALLALSCHEINSKQTSIKTRLSFISHLMITPMRLIDQTITWFINKPKSRNKSRYLTILISPLYLLLWKCFYSSQDTYDLDLLSSNLTNNESLAQALWKLDAYSQTLPIEPLLQHLQLFTVNPLTNRGLALYFYQAPTTKKRVRHLRGSI